MKYPAIFVLLVSCYAHHANAQELPLLGKLPQLGQEWVLQNHGSVLQNQETTKKGAYEYSWATFTNTKTGDIKSFAADRYTNINRRVGDSAVRQSASDMFPGGLPRFMFREPTGWRIADPIRQSVKTIGLLNALDYTYVYDSESASAPNRLGHGYALAFGDTVIFVQHTSAHVITSEDAMAMATSVLRNHSSSGSKQ